MKRKTQQDRLASTHVRVTRQWYEEQLAFRRRAEELVDKAKRVQAENKRLVDQRYNLLQALTVVAEALAHLYDAKPSLYDAPSVDL